jgi:ribosomal protein S18 acetylase RimI-like enzyme
MSTEEIVEVSCRLFVDADLRALYAIEDVCFEPPLRFSRALMRSLAFDPDSRTWVAVVDGVRAGFAMVGLKGDDDPTAAYIWTIEVLPVFRRMGVARELMLRMEESAREAGCAAIELHVAARNEDALGLYEGAGFVRVDVEREFYGLGVDGFRYRKGLPVRTDEDTETSTTGSNENIHKSNLDS